MTKTSIGIGLALLSAALFSINTPIASYGQSNGADPLVYAFVRGASTALISGIIAIALGASFHVPRKHWPALVLMIVSISLQGMFYLSSVGYIPVGLAALLFYLHPILVVLLTTILKQGPLATRTQWFCFLIAFLGLGFALGPEITGLDWRGVVMAFGAALMVAIYLVAARSSIGDVSFLALSFYGSLGTAVLSLVAISVLRPTFDPLVSTIFTWPSIAIAVIFPAAFLVQLAALRNIDSKMLALLFNIEPLLSIAIAAVFLNELLTAQQLIGALLVVAALSAYGKLTAKRSSVSRHS